MKSDLHFALQDQLQALLHGSFSYSDQISHANYSCQLHVRGMDEHLSSFHNGPFDEPVGQPVELFDIFFGVVVEIDVEILEIFGSFCVLFAGNIEDMGDAKFEE